MFQREHWFWIGFAIAAVGMALVGYGAHTARTAMETADWATAQGVIATSEVATAHRVRTADGNPSTPGAGEGASQAIVTYTYTVGGTGYTGRRIYASDDAGPGGGSERNLLDAYRAGQEVTVHYDPVNPANAVLEPRRLGPAYVMIGVGLAGLLIGLGLAAIGIRSPKTTEVRAVETP